MVAVRVMGNVPTAVGEPAIVAEPLGPAVKTTPEGNAPDSVTAGAGEPVEVTAKLPAVPTVKVAEPALVMAGAWSTDNVKLWLVVPVPFTAARSSV